MQVVEFTELFFEDQEWYFCTLAHTFGAQGSNRSTQFFTLWVNGKPVEKKEAKVERVPHHRAKHSLDQIIIGALSAAMPMPKHRRWLSLQMGTLQVFEGALSDWEVSLSLALSLSRSLALSLSLSLLLRRLARRRIRRAASSGLKSPRAGRCGLFQCCADRVAQAAKSKHCYGRAVKK